MSNELSPSLKPVVVVSVFGRGLWLAEKLKLAGIAVHFIDLTKKMGPYSLLDIQGPFPFFRSSQITEEIFQFWQKENAYEELSQGFSVLLQKGPVEFASSQLRHRLLSLGVDSHVATALIEKQQVKAANLKNKNLTEIWPYSLACFLSSPRSTHPVDSVEQVAMEITSPCYIGNLRPLRQRREEIPEQILSFVDYELEDISFSDRRKISGLLIKKERSELLECSQIVWTLGTMETKYYSTTLSEKIFGGHEREMQNTWQRWTFDIKGMSLPSQVLLLNDVELPWQQQNYLSLVRDFMTGFYSVWALVPSSLRLQKSMLDEKTQAIHQFLQQRLFACEVNLISSPIESGKTYKEIGPSIYGQWREGILDRRLLNVKSHFYELSPETTLRQDSAQFLIQEAVIFKKIELQWKLEQEAQRKVMEK